MRTEKSTAVTVPDWTASDAVADAGRQRLAEARILIVGVGALGSPAVLHLAAVGVGTLMLVDPDVVEISNLHRQIVHRTATVGVAKVDSAAAYVRDRYPAVSVEPYAERLTPDNLSRFFDASDFVIDATDGVAAKFLLNDGAVLNGRPYSHAGILGFAGQTMTVLPHRTACYRCLFPEPPPVDAVPTCQEAGILGGVAGVIGAVQAGEALNHVLGLGSRLANRLLIYDALSRRWRHVTLARNPHCPLCGTRQAGVTFTTTGAARYGG